MSIMAVGAADYSKAIDGLSLSQAKLLLSMQGLDAEQQKTLLLQAGLISSSEKMTASHVSQALSNSALKTSEQERVLIQAGLMDAQTRELILSNSCAEADLRAALATTTLSAAEKDEIVTKILGTTANGAYAISFDVLTASIWANIKAFAAWLVTNPVGWVVIAGGALFGLTKLFDAVTISAEELDEKLQELKATEEELASVQSKLADIDSKIAEIKSKGTLSITDKADISRLEQERLLLKDELELLRLKKELQQDEYNKSAKQYADEQYAAYTNRNSSVSALLNTYKGYKEKSQRTDIDDYFIEDAKKGLKETEAELIEYRNTINENLSNLAPDDEESRKKLEAIREAIEELIYTEEELAKIKFDRFIIDPNNTGISEGFEEIQADGEATAQEITDLANKFPALKKLMDDNGISAETLAAELNNVGAEAENSGAGVDKMTVSLSDLEKASDNIKVLSQAYKELDEDGYITIKTLGEIKTATGLSGDEWDEYQAKLMSAKAGSSQFNRVMSELTNKILDNTFAGKDLNSVTEEQIAATLKENGVINASAVAHEWLTKTKAKAKLSSFDFTTATEAETDALYQELKTIGLTEIEVKNLATLYASAQKTMLDAVQSGAAGRLGILQSELEGIKSLADAYALLGRGYDSNGDGTIDYVGTEINRMSPEQKAAYQAERAKIIAIGKAAEALKEIENITIPNYSGATSNGSASDGKSGSDKNKPSYEDPTDAVINRINSGVTKKEQESKSLKDQIEVAENDKDYATKLLLLGKLSTNRSETTKELLGTLDKFQNEIDYISNSNPWDETSWFDSEGNTTEAYYKLLNTAKTADEQTKIKGVHDKLKKYVDAVIANKEKLASLNQEILTDDETNDTLGLQAESDIADLEVQIALALEKDPYANVSHLYTQIQNKYHTEAERLRALDPVKYKDEINEYSKKWWEVESLKQENLVGISNKDMTNLENLIDSTLKKNPYANVSHLYGQLQEKYHTEAERLRALDPVKYQDEIAEYSRKWWDIEYLKQENLTALSDNSAEDIEKEIALTLEKNPYANVSYLYEQLQAKYHAEAERLRKLDPIKWKEKIDEYSKKWWDAENLKQENLSKIASGDIADIEQLIASTLEKDPYANVSHLYGQLQEKYHTEAERLRALDPVKYKDEINEYSRKWWEAEALKHENLSTEFEGRIKTIKHNMAKALSQNPYADTREYSRLLQKEYRERAEALRALDPVKYKDEIIELEQYEMDAGRDILDWRWDNSNRWIAERNTYNDWALFDDSEIDAWERVVKWVNEEYPNDLEKIHEAEQNLFEARKKELSKANSFGNTYLESQKTLLQSYYDVTNSVAEAQHEINKELETSKTMYEYLDEDTRKLLFNQEDYNKLSGELLEIQDKADKLQKQYERDLNKATLETVESITSNYKMQYETLMKSYEIAKADLEIAKKKQQLNNVLNERNVRMFINGSWQWVANTEDVANAKSELADAEYAKRVEEAGITQQESINSLTKRQDELGVVIKQFENGVITLDEAVDLAKGAIGNMSAAINSMFDNTSSSGDSGGYSSPSLVNLPSSSSFEIGKPVTGVLSESDINAIKTQMSNNSIKWHVAGESEKKELHEANQQLGELIGSSYDEKTGRWTHKYATGTKYTQSGLALMGEDGEEFYIPSGGRLIPINQPTIGNISSGGVVFNADQMKNLRTLWDMSNLKFSGGSTLISNAQPQQVNHNQDNRIIINGMTVDSGSADGQALISALRRYVGNH